MDIAKILDHPTDEIDNLFLQLDALSDAYLNDIISEEEYDYSRECIQEKIMCHRQPVKLWVV
jgi:hypothetical protein